MQRVVDALGALPVRGLATLGPALDAGRLRLPANVVACPSAPHAQILPRAAAVVTHAGHGTTIRALSAGVPLLCLPMGRDQNDTAARVVWHGAGLRLSPAARARKIRRAGAAAGRADLPRPGGPTGCRGASRRRGRTCRGRARGPRGGGRLRCDGGAAAYVPTRPGATSRAPIGSPQSGQTSVGCMVWPQALCISVSGGPLSSLIQRSPQRSRATITG